MTTRIPIDKAGRVVLPKPVRDRMRLSPGDHLVLESEEERITLRPDRARATLRKKRGIWVYHGSPSDVSISELIGRERDKRSREIQG